MMEEKEEEDGGEGEIRIGERERKVEEGKRRRMEERKR